MKTLTTALLALVLLGCGSAARDVARYDARTFYETTNIGPAGFSHDGSHLLLTSNQTGVYNAYRQPVGGGDPEPLTNSTTDAVFAIAYFPHDDRILYTQDQGGNELDHLYVLHEDGSTSDLTPGENLKASFVAWSGDRDRFYVATNERDPRYFDLYRYDTATLAREPFFTNADGYDSMIVSRDGRWVAASKTRTNADNNLFLWDSTHPETKPVLITPHEGDVSYSLMTFSPDSRGLLYGSDEGSEFTRVWSYNPETGERAPILTERWDVDSVSFSQSGRYRVVSLNQDARRRLSVIDQRSGEPLALPRIGDGTPTSIQFSPDEQTAALQIGGDRAPGDTYIYNMRDGTHQRMTHRLSAKINADDLVDCRVVRYTSFDGLPIPALLYKPHSASRSNPVPAVVLAHGGPGGQFNVGYSSQIQLLVNCGYAVLAVNNRGSSGYGKTFFHMDDKNHGDADLKDVVEARRYLDSLDWVDGSRVAIMGGSYGGYLVCAALAFHPDAFDAGIDIFGVTNWVRTLESIPPWWASFRESLYAELGDPATDKERLHAISPLFHAKNIRKPMLVIQGTNDPRVLQVESDEMVAAARANGVQVEYIIFPDEGHGFSKTENEITASSRIVQFLDKHLQGQAPR